MISRFIISFLFLIILPTFAASDDQRALIDQKLTQIHKNISISKERIMALVDQVSNLKQDQKTLTQSLIKTAARERVASNSISSNEDKLKKLLIEQARLGKELNAHKDEFYEVIAVLERIGIVPLPSILVKPEDALSAIRSAFLLGSAVPDMQEHLKKLISILEKYSKITQDIKKNITSLKIELENQQLYRKKLLLLLQKKAKLEKISEAELLQKRRESEQLAAKAKSFEDLLNSLNAKGQKDKRSQQIRMMIAQFHSSHNFEKSKHGLIRPISGKILRYYNNHSAHYFQGEIIEGLKGSIVTSPADAIVVYAGLFRSFGEIIILDVGKGYYILLAGLKNINVNQGQIVLAGEPIATMGDNRDNYTTLFELDSLKNEQKTNNPVIYIEFRKDGKAINPSPWWINSLSKRN